MLENIYHQIPLIQDTLKLITANSQPFSILVLYYGGHFEKCYLTDEPFILSLKTSFVELNTP